MVAFTMGCMMGKALVHCPHKGPRRRQYGLHLVFKLLNFFFLMYLEGNSFLRKNIMPTNGLLSLEECKPILETF
jgi:hypothetical protein